MENRIIKFRAWDIDNKKMTFSDAFWIITGSEVLLLNPHHKDTTYYKVENCEDGFEIMQFTGLHDKNGKEIYEGDIFKYKGEIWQIVYYDKSAMFVFNPTDKKGRKCIVNCGYVDHGEVIGNVFENQGLLK